MSTPPSAAVPRPVVAILVAAAIFVVAVFLPGALPLPSTARLATTQFVEVVGALAAIQVLGGGDFRAYGFVWPRSEAGLARRALSWLPVAAAAVAIGAVTSFGVLATGAGSNPVVAELGFAQVVLFVWISASTVEEVLARGFLQGHLEAGAPASRRGLGAPTWIAAAFFASMHLVLLLRGISAASLGITLAFTFTLGLLAGQQRAVSGSLVPAIGVHVLANMGGLLGGVAYVVLAMALGWPTPER